jgi:hypothetical protein
MVSSKPAWATVAKTTTNFKWFIYIIPWLQLWAPLPRTTRSGFIVLPLWCDCVLCLLHALPIPDCPKCSPQGALTLTDMGNIREKPLPIPVPQGWSQALREGAQITTEEAKWFCNFTREPVASLVFGVDSHRDTKVQDTAHTETMILWGQGSSAQKQNQTTQRTLICSLGEQERATCYSE